MLVLMMSETCLVGCQELVLSGLSGGELVVAKE